MMLNFNPHTNVGYNLIQIPVGGQLKCTIGGFSL